MSYDISIKFGNRRLYSDSHTYNVSDMYHKAFRKVIECSGLMCQIKGLTTLDGTDCVSALPILERAIQYFKDNKEELEKLNPSNGWGDYNGALQVLEDLYAECITRNSNCFVYIS